MRKFVAVVALLGLVLLPGVSRAAITPEDAFVTSFDGTKIFTHLFLPDGASATNPVPVILRTHGWGGSGETAVAGTLARLLSEGYAVLTWDQRGFGRSGGQAEIDDDDVEGRDVRVLIDTVAARAEILKVSGDPVVGMTGGSYAGGIQFSAASIDDRIDAIAPEISWSNLPNALFPSNVAKVGWDTLLYGVGQSGYRGYVEQQTFASGRVSTLNPNIHLAQAYGTATNDPSLFKPFFDDRSVINYAQRVDIPTLVAQGSVDTLFPLNHGLDNAAAVRANGAPVKLVVYNTGHTLGSSIPAGTARASMDDAIINWFAKYLKGQSVSTGADIEWQDGTAAWHTSSWDTVASLNAFSGVAENLAITPAPVGGGGPATGNPNVDVLAARIPIMTGGVGGTKILGVPRVSGTLTGAAADAFLFFKLVDTTTGIVLDDQVTPFRTSVLLDPVAFELDLHGVAWTLPEGHTLALEISTGSAMYLNSRVPGVVTATLSGTVPTI